MLTAGWNHLGVEAEKIQRVASLLGREPRGLEEIPVEADNGDPVVIRVASLVDHKPFPTLYWLVDPVLCYRIDQLEAAGMIKTFQQRFDADATLQARMREDHRVYIALRRGFMSTTVKARLRELGFEKTLEVRGIGGIADFSRIRCFHTWYGAHLVRTNVVGEMLDDWWAGSPQSVFR